MDEISFYISPSVPNSQAPRLQGAVPASAAPKGPMAARPNRQTASLVNQHHEISKDQMGRSQDVSDSHRKGHLPNQRPRNDRIVPEQENLIAARDFPNSSDDDGDFPDIDELLSGVRRKSIPATVDLGGNDGGDGDSFADIDEFLSGTQQESGPAHGGPDCSGMADTAEDGSRGGTPTDSSCSTTGSSRDPIILSDDESAGAESDTDCSDLGVDVRAKSDPHPPHAANGGRRESNLRLNTEITQEESTSHDNLDANKELQGEDFDVSAEGGDVDSRSMEGRMLSAASDSIPASGTDISGLQDSQPDDARSSQLVLAAASPHQSNLDHEDMSKQGRRRASRNDRRKRRRTREAAPTRLATTANAASATPESAGLEGHGLKPCAQMMAPHEDWEPRDTDGETVNSGSADDSEDEDYSDTSDVARPRRGGRRHSRKRVRRTKDTSHSDVEAGPPHLLDSSCRAAAATPPNSTEESEEMPIHGYFTLRTVGSRVLYCLTFSQEMLPLARPQGQRQAQPATLPSKRKRVAWTTEENRKIVKMKKEGCSWEEIRRAIPDRTRGAIQVQYSTKLKKK